MEHESDTDTKYNRCSWYSHQMISIRTGEIGNKKTSGYHPNNIINNIGQNTGKSPGDWRRLAVCQISVRNDQLKLAWKILKGVIVI